MSSGHFSRRGSPTPDVIRTRIERNQTANAVILFFDLGLEKLKSLFSTTKDMKDLRILKKMNIKLPNIVKM